MNNQKKAASVAKQVVARKPPKKLVPRPAEMPVVEVAVPVVPVGDPVPAIEQLVPEVDTPATAAATAKARPARKPSRADETVARHQKSLADALEKAQAISYEQPKIMKQEVDGGKKPAKVKKPRLVRDSYAMPESEYALIGEIKKRLLDLGDGAKKSEVLRGGIALLAALNDAELKAVMARVVRIKTGRPVKDDKK